MRTSASRPPRPTLVPTRPNVDTRHDREAFRLETLAELLPGGRDRVGRGFAILGWIVSYGQSMSMLI